MKVLVFWMWLDRSNYSNLNGGYNKTSYDGIHWTHWKNEPLKFSEMKFQSK